MEVTPYAPPVAVSPTTSPTSTPSVSSTSDEDMYIESESNLNSNDFLQIMAAQLANQSIMDPIDTAQYITQMAVMANTVQMMYVSEQITAQFATSLIGQEVTIAGYDADGAYQEWTGEVDSVVFQGGETWIEMDGFLYSPDDVVQISGPMPPPTANNDLPEPEEPPTDGTEEPPPTDGTEEPPPA